MLIPRFERVSARCQCISDVEDGEDGAEGVKFDRGALAHGA